MSTRDEQAERTRGELLRAARALFTAHGYNGVGTEQIVSAAGLTRGALYHHFTDKRDLFRAVHEQIETETIADIAAAVAAETTAEAGLVAGLRAFLDICTDPTRARVTLLDAPAVLGWAQWRAIDERLALGLVRQMLTEAMAAGALARRPVDPLASLLNAAANEAAQLIATAPDPAAARAEVEPALRALIDGLRA